MTRSTFKYFAIFGAMRTGSNLLERTLAQFDDFLCHGELFNPSFVGKPGQTEFEGVSIAEREANPERILKKMVNRSGDALPGFRIFQGHDPRIMERCLADPACAKIILRRRPIDSFVSLKIAQQTDQWMLGNAPMRKSAVIEFDGAAFRHYLGELDAYHGQLSHALQTNGQAAFEIRYEDLKSIDVINGLAKFLGSDQELSGFAEKIKRQNPQPLEEKVSNYDQMVSELGALGLEGLDAARAPETERGISVRDFVVCARVPVLHVPVPGVDAQVVLDWMAKLDGTDAGSLATGMNQKKLGRWLDGATGLSAIAVVEHPLQRAYRVFRKHIYPGGAHIFPQIQSRLVDHFGLDLPEDHAGDDEGLAAAFETFLEFLKSNVAGQTSIRIDANWEAQHRLLSGVHPLTRVLHRNAFPVAAREIAQALGSDVEADDPAPAEGLNRIYTRRLENLARGTYGKDYALYGFADWEAV